MDHEASLIVSAIIVFLLNLIYLKPAIAGMTRQSMTMRGLASINFRKTYHLEGPAALLMGMFLIACDIVLIVGWMALVMRIFSGGK